MEITSFNELKYFTGLLYNVYDPVSTIALDYMTFAGCSNLEEITLMPNIQIINGSVFSRCTSLKSIILPDTLEFINTNVFEYCTSLVTVKLPETLTQPKFSGGLFMGCSSLTSLIEISAITTSIGIRAFYGCTSLSGVKMLGSIPPSIEYEAFGGRTTFPIYVPEAAVNAYKSASGWTSLASRIMGY